MRSDAQPDSHTPHRSPQRELQAAGVAVAVVVPRQYVGTRGDDGLGPAAQVLPVVVDGGPVVGGAVLGGAVVGGAVDLVVAGRVVAGRVVATGLRVVVVVARSVVLVAATRPPEMPRKAPVLREPAGAPVLVARLGAL